MHCYCRAATFPRVTIDPPPLRRLREVGITFCEQAIGLVGAIKFLSLSGYSEVANSTLSPRYHK